LPDFREEDKEFLLHDTQSLSLHERAKSARTHHRRRAKQASNEHTMSERTANDQMDMSRKSIREQAQLTLDDARKPTGRGGWRPRAGRPRGRANVTHDRRESVAERYPQHVTMRIAEDVSSLRQPRFMELIRKSIAAAQRVFFRIVHFNVLSNHLHLIIEAAGVKARALGITGLEVRLARRINALVGRTGKLFPERYHARALTTPTEVRNAIRYVLNNALHHDPHITFCLGEDWIDPCSSAAWFDGWAQPIKPDRKWKRDLLEMPAPTVKPQTWLLSVGWRRHGAIRFDEMPGTRAEREAWAMPAAVMDPY